MYDFKDHEMSDTTKCMDIVQKIGNVHCNIVTNIGSVLT